MSSLDWSQKYNGESIMCVQVVYIHTYVRIYVCICMYERIPMPVHLYVFMSVFEYVCIYKCMYDRTGCK